MTAGEACQYRPCSGCQGAVCCNELSFLTHKPASPTPPPPKVSAGWVFALSVTLILEVQPGTRSELEMHSFQIWECIASFAFHSAPVSVGHFIPSIPNKASLSPFPTPFQDLEVTRRHAIGHRL